MSLIEHNQNLSVTLSDDEARRVVNLISRGISEEQALSLTGYNRQAWLNHVAVMVEQDSEWLSRLTARGSQYIGAKAIERVVEHLESDACDPRFALDVLGRRDAGWSSRGVIDHQTGGKDFFGGAVDPKMLELKRAFEADFKEKICSPAQTPQEQKE